QERDRHAVAALALLAGPQLFNRLVGLQMAADRRTQRAGAVAVDDEDRVAAGHQALVDEAVDLGHRLVDPVAADIERGVHRRGVGPAAGRYAVAQLEARTTGAARPVVLAVPGVATVVMAVAAARAEPALPALAVLAALAALAAPGQAMTIEQHVLDRHG